MVPVEAVPQAPPAQAPARGPRRWLRTGIRIAIAAVPIAWILGRIRWAEVGHRLEQIGPWAYLASVAFCLGCFLVGAIRWRVLLRAYGATPLPPARELFFHSLVGAYFNVMPSGVAGDAVRGYRVRESLPGLATSYAILLVDRLAGMAGLLVLALGSAAFGPSMSMGRANQAMAVAFALALVLALAALGFPYVIASRPGLRSTVSRVPVIGATLSAVPPIGRPGALVSAAALSVITQALFAMVLLTLLSPLVPMATLLGCLRVSPLVVLLIFVPLTPGGVGQREAVFVELFGLAGVPADAAIAAALMTFAVGMTVSGLGGVRLAWERLARDRAPA
jgi:uncharacterized membrane protein YbhN (UPF0104 family)